MGRVPVRGFPQQGYASPSAFYGEEQAPKPKSAPGAGGRPAVPGGPMLPRNPFAEFAWRRQYLLGAMNQPRVQLPRYIVKVG